MDALCAGIGASLVDPATPGFSVDDALLGARVGLSSLVVVLLLVAS